MFIAHVFFTVAPENAATALKTLTNEVKSVRAMKGCRAVVPFIDPLDASTLGVLHEWESAEDFAAYTASPAFAQSGQALRPMMTEAPISLRFDAQLLEAVN